MNQKTISRRGAFTLIELLVVIAIISLLVSILLPSLTKAKGLARSVVCRTNLRSLQQAQEFYADDYGTYAVTEYQYNYPINRLEPYLGDVRNSHVAVGEAVNHEPYCCPEVGPGILQSDDEVVPTGHSYAWNYHLGRYYESDPYYWKNWSPAEVHNPAETVGWGDMERHAGFYKAGYGFGVHQRLMLRHGGGTTVFVDDLMTDPSLQTSNTANTSFLDGHCESLDQDAVLVDEIYLPDE